MTKSETEHRRGLGAAFYVCYVLWLGAQAFKWCWYVVKFIAEYYEWFGRKWN